MADDWSTKDEAQERADGYIIDYLGRIAGDGVKKIKMDTLEDDLATEGLYYVSSRHMGGLLRRAGWSNVSDGYERYWLAPGVSKMSAGIGKPADMSYQVGLIVGGILEGLESVKAKELHALVAEVLGNDDAKNYINRSMESRERKGLWFHENLDGQKVWFKAKEKKVKKPDPI